MEGETEARKAEDGYSERKEKSRVWRVSDTKGSEFPEEGKQQVLMPHQDLGKCVPGSVPGGRCWAVSDLKQKQLQKTVRVESKFYWART